MKSKHVKSSSVIDDSKQVKRIDYKDNYDLSDIALLKPFTVTDPNVSLEKFTIRPKIDFLGLGFDTLIFQVHAHLKRLATKETKEFTVKTIVSVDSGFIYLCKFLQTQTMFGRAIQTMHDIDGRLINDFVCYLNAGHYRINSRASMLSHIKMLVVSYYKFNSHPSPSFNPEAIFPPNPFPLSGKKTEHVDAFSKAEIKSIAAALAIEANEIINSKYYLDSYALCIIYLAISLNTGFNHSVITRLNVDCLAPHPKPNTSFIIGFKSRSHKAQRSELPIISESSGAESIDALCALLIKKLIELNADIRNQLPEKLRSKLFAFKSRSSKDMGRITTLIHSTVSNGLSRFVNKYHLTKSSGELVKLNSSKFRQRLANEVFERTQSAVLASAALGNTPQVTNRSYLDPSPEERKDFISFISSLDDVIESGIKNTPSGKCRNLSGNAEPNSSASSENDSLCTSFLKCFVCKHYVVSGDDLYKIYSLYWRIVRERQVMDNAKWKKQFRHIISVIDKDIMQNGIASQVFTKGQVRKARDMAKENPHPFWNNTHFETLVTNEFRSKAR